MDIDSSISQIMTRDVVAVSPDTPVPQVARLLWEHQLTGIPVLEGQRVVGVITEFDLISRETEYEAPLYFVFLDAYFRIPGTTHEDQLRRILATTAGELMSSPAVTVTPDTTIQDVATIMYEKRVNPVPVVDEHGRLVGIVSRSDIVRLMVREEAGHQNEAGAT